MEHHLIDPHVHTSEVSPCGRIPARRMVRLYQEAGFQGIVITDHFFARLPGFAGPEAWERKVESYLSGYRQARDEGERAGLAVLWGLELTFNDGVLNDYLVFGLDETFLKESPPLFLLDLTRVRELARDHKILIYQAHPFRPVCAPGPPRLLDGVEVYNGNPRHASDNPRAREYARKHGLRQIAGSDAHQPEDVGRAGIYLPRSPRSAGELVELLSANGDPRLFIRDNGQDP